MTDELPIQLVLEIARERLAKRPTLLARLEHEAASGMLHVWLTTDVHGQWVIALNTGVLSGHVDPAIVEARAVRFIDAWAARQKRTAVEPLPPVPPALTVTATPAQPRILKRRALIAEFEAEWPTITGDISEASRNGLNRARAADGKGWDVDKARAWATDSGKIRRQPKRQPASPWTGMGGS